MQVIDALNTKTMIELQQQLQKQAEVADGLQKLALSIDKNNALIKNSGHTSTKIIPELEVSRRIFYQQIHQDLISLQGQQQALVNEQISLQKEIMRLKKQLKLYEKYMEKQQQERLQQAQRSTYKALDDWSVQRRQRHEN